MSSCSVRREVDMATPYFMPDESVFTALLTAAERGGVNVTVIVPERNKAQLVHFTSRYSYAIILVA